MSEREQIRKTPSSRDRRDEEENTPPTQNHVDIEKVKTEIDDLLDEIDDVLETNAEEFVKSYVQKGGQ